MEKGMKVVRKCQEDSEEEKWDWAPLNHSPVKSWLQYYAFKDVCMFVLV